MISQTSATDKTLLILISETKEDVKTLRHLYKTTLLYGLYAFWEDGFPIKYDLSPLFPIEKNRMKADRMAETYIKALRTKFPNAEAIGIVSASQKYIND